MIEVRGGCGWTVVWQTRRGCVDVGRKHESARDESTFWLWGLLNERLDQWEAVQPTCRGAAGSEGGGGHGTTRIAGAESGGCSDSSGNGDGDGGNGSGSSSGGGGGGGARGSAASAISVRARQLEHLSFFFADQFIMPSDDLEWRLAFGSETAAGSQCELQATTGGVGADNAESDCCVSRGRGGCVDVDPGGACGDGVDSAFVAVCNGVDAGNGAARAEVSVAAATLRCVREDDVRVLRFEGQVRGGSEARRATKAHSSCT
eukprot:6191360-Pleurochrysis_carterae.AAC.2